MKGDAINDYARAPSIKEELFKIRRYDGSKYRKPYSKIFLVYLNFPGVLQTKFHDQIALCRLRYHKLFLQYNPRC